MLLEWTKRGRDGRPRPGNGTAMRFLPKWRKIAVPAFGAPYSERAIQAACRVVDGVESAEVRLVYVLEVPRALAMATPLPGEEALAEQFLSQGRDQAAGFDAFVTTDVVRGREAVDTLVRYLKQAEIDLVVLGSRADEVRGLPLSVTREIFSRSPCPVLLDHIAAETEPSSESAELG